jgi:hypothetical protein
MSAFAETAGEEPIRCGTHLRDFSQFQICFGDPDNGPATIDCRAYDFDDSGVVDLTDFASRRFVLRPRIAIFPANVQITYSQQLDFHFAVYESGNPEVFWSVRRVPGGEPGESLGSIDADGRYTPPSPSHLHAASEVIVEVSRQGSVQASEFACVTIYGTIVADPPASAVLPGPGGAGGFVSSVTVANPRTALVLPGPGDPDLTPANVTVALPPAAIVLPGEGEPNGVPSNVTIGSPPVAVVLPDAGDLAFLTPNVTLANPPVSVAFEDAP